MWPLGICTRHYSKTIDNPLAQPWRQSAPGRGSLSLKTGGCVPRATENWTQKDRGKNGIWDQKDLILKGLVPKKIIWCWWITKSTPQKDLIQSSEGQKRGSKRRHICITNIKGVPAPNAPPHPPQESALRAVLQRGYENVQFSSGVVSETILLHFCH